ncbi:hypothetical protein RU639_012792 [Aspergillus parasiticus]
MVFTRDDYTVAWVCALPLELAAAKAMLDKEHPPLPQPESDHNVYTLGSVSGHNVVVAPLPSGVYGTISASTVVSHMVSTYPKIRFGLMVGIGGGVPSKSADIRLGDVVISKPTATSTGVIQYDYGKTLRDGRFQHTGSLNKPPPVLLKAMSQLESDSMTGQKLISEILFDVLSKREGMKEQFSRPKDDWLFRSTYNHENSEYNCSACDQTHYESVEQAYISTASKLEMTDLKPAEVKEKVKAYLSQESAGKWLLIFDNADDMEMWSEDNTNSPVLTDFLPQCEQGHILFTTRSRKVAVKLASPYVITISEPDTEIAVKILQNSLVEKNLLNDRGTAITLLEQLAFLPLAITQAAAYINENSIGLSDYLMLLKDQEPGVIELLSENFGDEGRYKETQNPVALTWFISFQQIQRSNKLAADYLAFMACINPRNVPQALLPQPNSIKKRIDAIGLLKAFSFVSEGGGDGSLNLHRLVHLATRNWMRKSQQFSLQIVKTANRLSEAFPNNDHTNRKVWREYLPHAFSLIAEADFQKEQERYINLIINIGDCLYSDSRWKEAEELQLQVMEHHKQVLGPEHLDTLTSIANLASIYRNQGRWKKAEELEVQVMEHRKQVLGLEYPDTLISMANLASTYQNQGRWKEAEELEVQVIELSKQVLGPEHPDTLISITNLASTYRNQGRWKEAEELEVQVIELSKQVLGPEHPDTLTSMANLASTYWNQGRWKEAEELEVQVMEHHKQILGPEHPDTLTSIANLALTYWNQGRWKEAEELQLQVIEHRKQVLGPEHPNTLTSIANLASTYWDQRRWKEAEELEVQVMELSKQVLGLEHPDTLTSMANLAYTWKLLGKVQDALALMKKCVELRQTGKEQRIPYQKSTQQTSAATPPALPIYNNRPKQIKSDSEPVTGGKRWALKRVFRRR